MVFAKAITRRLNWSWKLKETNNRECVCKDYGLLRVRGRQDEDADMLLAQSTIRHIFCLSLVLVSVLEIRADRSEALRMKAHKLVLVLTVD